MKEKTVFMTAVLAVATVLAAGLIVLPNSVQEAQSVPCDTILISRDNGPGSGQITVNQGPTERECKFVDYPLSDEDLFDED
jgi:hypothetical protein